MIKFIGLLDLIKMLTNPTKELQMDPLKALFDALAELQAKLADASALLKSEYDRGFADGVLSVSVDPEKKFSQADLDAAVSAAVGPLNDQIAALKAQVDGLPDLIKAAVGDEDKKIHDKIDAIFAPVVSE